MFTFDYNSLRSLHKMPFKRADASRQRPVSKLGTFLTHFNATNMKLVEEVEAKERTDSVRKQT